MRDFYLTYKDELTLLVMALDSSWTQNTAIMEYCETMEQRAFYIQLILDENLSKLKLIEAIDCKTYEATQIHESNSESVSLALAPVFNFIFEKAHDIGMVSKSKYKPFRQPCEHIWQIVVVLVLSRLVFYQIE